VTPASPSNPEVSVVMAVYNGLADLAETLDSILKQAGCVFEVIVVDDGSSDGSGSLLDAMAGADARIVAIHQANQGLTRALMRGCEIARGEFIARQDVGDLSLPGRLAAQAAFLRKHPGCAFVACQHAALGPAGEHLSRGASEHDTTGSTLRNRDGKAQVSPHHGSVMFRRSTYAQAGGYRPQFYFAQDVDLWSRLIEHGDLGWVPGVLYQVKFDLASITARHRSAQQRLRDLVAQAVQLRREGLSEAEILRQAAEIRPGAKMTGEASAAASRGQAAYFVGSCLAQMNDPRGRAYLRESLRHNPLHFKSWIKLVSLSMRSWKAGQ
jgi:glycosyltransferase involved in cell wall biosynthesis